MDTSGNSGIRSQRIVTIALTRAVARTVTKDVTKTVVSTNQMKLEQQLICSSRVAQ